MDKEMMNIMVNDWIANNYEGESELILENEPYYDEFLKAWVQDATDGYHNYYLVESNGNIDIY